MEKPENFLFHISLLLYLSASVIYILELYLRSKNFGKLPLWKVRIGFLFQSASLIIQYIKIGYPPSNLTNNISLFTWTTIFFYLMAIQKKWGHKALGAFVLPMAFVLNCYGIIVKPKLINNEMPAFHNFWFFTRVPINYLGYGSLAIAFFGAIIYFIQERNLKHKNIAGIFRRLPSILFIDEMCYKMVTIGFPLLTLGIISGAIWAQTTWGFYWYWDIKEIWTFITWAIYAFYLHVRLVGGWRGRKTNFMLIIGFISIIITLIFLNS